MLQVLELENVLLHDWLLGKFAAWHGEEWNKMKDKQVDKDNSKNIASSFPTTSFILRDELKCLNQWFVISTELTLFFLINIL